MPKGGARPGAGRPKGSFKSGVPGRKTLFRSFTVSSYPEEYEEIKSKAAEAGKSVSRFLIDLALGK